MSPVPSQDASTAYNQLSDTEKAAIVVVKQKEKKRTKEKEKPLLKRKRLYANVADADSVEQEADVADGVFFTFNVFFHFFMLGQRSGYMILR